VISFNNFIQIAGISDKNEAEMLINASVNFLGFPLRLPVNKEDILENDAAEIIKSLNPPNYGIVITYLNIAEEIASFCSELNSNIVQLHGNIETSELQKLKNIAPSLIVIKSLIVGKYKLDELKKAVDEQSEFVDAFITDTFNPQNGATGATGLTHDWEISKNLVQYSTKPIILAGGLNPNNVYDAIIKVKPIGVDSHTGVEDENGAKDLKKVQKFISESNRAFEKLKELSAQK
jgi:phosphoribosylanthranilate isomerase